MPAAKIDEVQRLLDLLRTQLPFEMAVLYGAYADGRMRSEAGGYELLLVTAGEPDVEGWQLEALLHTVVPPAKRIERTIHIETVDIHLLNTVNTANWFFWRIRQEGTIVCDAGDVSHGFFRATRFKHDDAYRFARRQYDYYFTTGVRMLDDAERAWTEGKSPQAAIMLSYAPIFLLRAEELVHFGYAVRTSNLFHLVRRARHFSKPLAEEYDLTQIADTRFLESLRGLRHVPRRQVGFELAEKKFRRTLNRLRKLQRIVQCSCEPHLSYLEHWQPAPASQEQDEDDVRAQAADA